VDGQRVLLASPRRLGGVRRCKIGMVPFPDRRCYRAGRSTPAAATTREGNECKSGLGKG
jgi:hypothetical protein